MDKEELELQQRLLDKIEEWRNSPAFGKGSTDQQKYVRAKGMLQATHPKVLTEVLGITSVPNVPLEAMNRIRTMDLSTLKNLEIFRGLDDKVVGHHMSAFGAISGALENQSPERRLELLNRAIDSDYITGMDPKGIGPIRTSIHRPIAHQGDWSGKKPGYKTPTFSNTDNIEDIWTSLESSLKQQKNSFDAARAHQSTQDLVSASKGVFGTDLITELDVPMEIRKQASQAADPLARNISNIITEFSGNNEQIETNARNLLDNLNVKQQSKFNDLQVQRGVARFVKNPAVRRAAALAPFVGTLIGAGTVEANAASRDEEIAANPNDPTLHVNKALDQVSGWGDRTSLAGMAATATGVGAPVGVPATAIGELTSLGAGLASMVIDATRGTINLIRNPEKIKELKPANMEFTTM